MMDITIKNPDGSDAGLSIIFYQIDKYMDKPGTCEITANPVTTITENSTLEAHWRGTIRFRGYIDIPEENEDQTIRIVAYEQQRLLEYRFTQYYTYDAGTSILSMLSDQEPTSCVGLLYMANSLIPQGAFVPYSGNTYYIKDYLGRGGGTASKFGTITKMYANATLLTKGTSPILSSGQWYQDSDDLYVRMPDDRDPAYWLVSIPNWKDTKLRLSPQVSLTSTLPVPYRIGKTDISQELDRMILAFGKEFQWIHETDGYTYLYVATTIGRGSPSKGIINFRENDTIYTYAVEQTGDPRIDCLVGAGSGSGVTQETYSVLNLYAKGNWKEDLYTDSHQFKEELQNSMPIVFPDKMEPISISITTDEDPAVNPGDYGNILLEKSLPITKRIKKISYTSDSEMKVWLGQRVLDLTDVTQGKFDLLSSYNDFANTFASSWTFSFNNDNITDTVPFTQTFTVASDEIDKEYPYRFLMSVNIGWYKDPKGSVDSAAHSHSGSTGGGGSHAHSGSTASGGSHPHEASGTTQGYVGYAISCATGGNTGYSGNHQHPVSTYSAGGHSHSVTAYGYVPVTPYSVSVSGSTSSAGDHSHSGAATAPGDHKHGLSLTFAEVAGAHSHYLPPSQTSYNANDTRGIYTQDNHTNPMVTEAQKSTVQTNYASLCPTGYSIHYLTLTIKINGTNVPGSPFANYYPGDSISDINITNLVNVAGENTIWIGISEYGGSSPVRCSVYGSINSKYFITNL